ncbi:MAG: hypothetical protein WAR24_23515, partial [Candidatus Acidiferrales bacterium]
QPVFKADASSNEQEMVAAETSTSSLVPRLLQLGVFGLGGDEDGNVGVGVRREGFRSRVSE